MRNRAIVYIYPALILSHLAYLSLFSEVVGCFRECIDAYIHLKCISCLRRAKNASLSLDCMIIEIIAFNVRKLIAQILFFRLLNII